MSAAELMAVTTGTAPRQPSPVSEVADPERAPGARAGRSRDPREQARGSERGRRRAIVSVRGLTVVLLAVMIVSLLVAVPGLHSVAGDIAHLGAGWLLLAGAFELASCASFVVVFRHFFPSVAARSAREVAWAEMGSGALLPGGGVGSLAVGGWLLHLAGMPTRQIVRSSSGLFFLTSAVNVAALIAGGLLVVTGLSTGKDDFLLAGVPIIVGAVAIAATLAVAGLGERRSRGFAHSKWIGPFIGGIIEARRALRHPGWRLIGAIGYLGFDVAVLWATLTGVGYSPPLGVLILGYIIGYLANLIPAPGGIGVLEAGLAGTLVLYGAPVAPAAAGVLVYHAIAFWIPSLGGVVAYRRFIRRPLGASAARAQEPESDIRPAPQSPASASRTGAFPPG